MSKSRIIIDGKTYVPLESAKLKERKPTETLGEKIKRLRQEQGLTAPQLAEKMGTSHQAIYQVEGGKNNDLRLSTLRAYCRALNVSADELTFTKEDS